MKSGPAARPDKIFHSGEETSFALDKFFDNCRIMSQRLDNRWKRLYYAPSSIEKGRQPRADTA